MNLSHVNRSRNKDPASLNAPQITCLPQKLRTVKDSLYVCPSVCIMATNIIDLEHPMQRHRLSSMLASIVVRSEFATALRQWVVLANCRSCQLCVCWSRKSLRTIYRLDRRRVTRALRTSNAAKLRSKMAAHFQAEL